VHRFERQETTSLADPSADSNVECKDVTQTCTNKSSQTDLRFAAVALNAEGAGVLAEDAKVIIFLCDLCEILRVLCVEIPSCGHNGVNGAGER